MGCLLLPFRVVAGLAWRALLAALVAILFAQVDGYVERRYGASRIGRLYSRYRRRTQRVK